MNPVVAEDDRWDEAEVLSALGTHGVLGAAPEQVFDDIARLAARVFDAPMATVSLADEGRIWFKAQVGLGLRETPRETSFCVHAMDLDDMMVVPDATRDPRFAGNPLVTGEMHLRFYAGQPLRTPDGVAIGAVCVLDREPRPQGVTELQAMTLKTLASHVTAQLELRRALRQRDETEAMFRILADAMPQLVWSTLPDGRHDYFNAQWRDFTGTPEGQGWKDVIHPEDRLRARELWRRSLKTGEPYEIEYRLRHHSGVHRWTLTRAVALRDESGRIIRWFGAGADIDDLKRLEREHELVSQELSHRIKNIFAVVSALIALSARRRPEAKEFADALRTRIGALARAHEFVRPHTESSQPTVGPTTLHAFFSDLFGAYVDDEGGPRVRLSGEDAVFDDQAATSVALLFHELATNAAKYGALSEPGGRVELRTGRDGDRFVLTWTETGGPPVAGPPAKGGFGSSLAALSVEGQLGGRLDRQWRPEGLKVVVDLPETALARRRAARRA